VQGIDDVLTYALFPEVGLDFLEHRGDPSAFEPAPDDPTAAAPAAPAPASAARPDQPERYTVAVDGRNYDVVVSPAGACAAVEGEAVTAPLAGSIFRILVKPGQRVSSGEILLIMEAMKMETEVRAPKDGMVSAVSVREGDTVELGHALAHIA